LSSPEKCITHFQGARALHTAVLMAYMTYHIHHPL
jgi:hypothetical protein